MSKATKSGAVKTINTKAVETMKAEFARVASLPMEQREAEALKMFQTGQTAINKAKDAQAAALGKVWNMAILYALQGVTFEALESKDAQLIKSGTYRASKSTINTCRREAIPLVDSDGMPRAKDVLTLLIKGKVNGVDLSAFADDKKALKTEAAKIKGKKDKGETPKTREATPEEIIRSAFLHMEQEPEKYLFPIKAKIARLVAMIDANTASKRKAAKGTAPAKGATVPSVDAGALVAAMAGVPAGAVESATA